MDSKGVSEKKLSRVSVETDDSISSSLCMNQISSVSTTDSKNSSNPNEKKATHSEIEKRRRQKMNKHLSELALHLPGVNQKNKKPDKLTILKLAVQHLRNLKESNTLLNDSFICQSFMKPNELQSLVLNEAQDFLIMIRCDSSKILFVSENCSNAIGFSSKELIDRSFLEIVHISDHKQVKDQLCYQEKIPCDSDANLKKKSRNTGDRRSFYCRIRSGLNETNRNNKRSFSSVEEPEYKMVHFYGHLRSDFNHKYESSIANTSSKIESNLVEDPCSSSSSQLKVNNNDTLFRTYHSTTFLDSFESDMNQKRNHYMTENKNKLSNSNQTQHYLLAYAQTKSKVNELDQTKFVTKHDVDGKFLFAEPCIYSVLGFLPQQLLSESLFNYVHVDDIQMLKKCFQEAIFSSPLKIKTREYRIKLENNKSFALIESVIFALKNPLNNNLEYIMLQNKFNSISFTNNSTALIQQQDESNKKKHSLMQSPTLSSTFNGNGFTPMTPSPEDDQNGESNTKLLNDCFQGKKVPPSPNPIQKSNNQFQLQFNSAGNIDNTRKQESMFHTESNNLLMDSAIGLNQFNILPSSSNSNDIFSKQTSQHTEQNEQSFVGLTNNQENSRLNPNNLRNQHQQFIFDLGDRFNDYSNGKNFSTINTTDEGRPMEKRQSSYNLMIKNNSIQENTDMLMEILRNEKIFQTSIHSNSSNQKT